MSVPQELIHPLTLSTFIVDKRLAGYPLQIVAKRYLDPANPTSPTDPSGISILLTSGIGLTTELWIPVIKSLYQLNAKSRSDGVRIRSVWAVDCPNHGDAGVLNEQVLKERYADEFSLRDYGTTISTFLSLGLLDEMEKSTLVAVGHCGGTAGLTACASEAQSELFKAMILVEPPWFDRSVEPIFKIMVRHMGKENKKRPREWATVEDAISYLVGRPPCKTWHPHVVRVMAGTFFRPVPREDKVNVTLKTSMEQEAATFAASKEAFEASELLGPVMRRTPVHIILGSRTDFWPKPINDVLHRVVEAHRSQLASIVTVHGAGHHIPQEKPEELASAIMHILQNDRGRPSARL